ncbi:response regulator transcription factor [Micromonospora sp. NPDC049204]|uniref:response regulator transcription factor n=1 Tax=unclassified Micromonospora TaxID=2617518 RepID=UPI0033F4938E
MRALVVDSDNSRRADLSAQLKRHGFDVTECGTGAEAIGTLDRSDLMLIDLCLRDMDGVEACRRVRATSDVPLIAFTEQHMAVERVLSLQAGCDDCVTKPYGVRELLARIEAIMRRVRAGAGRTRSGAVIIRGDLHIDPRVREVRVHGNPVQLTRKEFDLLHHLAGEPDVVHSRTRLATEVWGFPADTYTPSLTTSRTIDTHVSALRTKLGDRDVIVTVRGVGFRLGRSMPSRLSRAG